MQNKSAEAQFEVLWPLAQKAERPQSAASRLPDLSGKTVGELEKLLTDGLRGSYLVNPRVSVTIDEYRPYFINGQVGNNGSFPYQPGLTVRKAVSIAGGFKERASMSKIFIVRDGDATNTPVRADLNTQVHPGDIITVGESFF